MPAQPFSAISNFAPKVICQIDNKLFYFLKDTSCLKCLIPYIFFLSRAAARRQLEFQNIQGDCCWFLSDWNPLVVIKNSNSRFQFSIQKNKFLSERGPGSNNAREESWMHLFLLLATDSNLPKPIFAYQSNEVWKTFSRTNAKTLFRVPLRRGFASHADFLSCSSLAMYRRKMVI